jgi:diketogulonate reductase-like aldo/keto reductase
VASDDPGVLRATARAGIFDVVQTAVNSTSSKDLAEIAPILVAAGLPIVANQVLSDLKEGRAVAPGHLLRHAAAQTGVRAVLCRTSRPDHLRANAAALDAPLTDQDRLTGYFR